MTVTAGDVSSPVVRIQSPLPPSLQAGTATVLFMSGIAVDGSRPVRALTLIVDGRPQRVTRVGMPRFDVPERRGGFWATVALRVPADASQVTIDARAVGRDDRVSETRLATIPVDPPRRRPDRGDRVDARAASVRDGPSIAICMATHQPDLTLLQRQLDSIRSQTDTDWTCVVSDDCSDPARYQQILRLVGDDPRFSVSRAPAWLGFYRNFERALLLAPDCAQLLAPCDQDDVWHPDKLATLRASIAGAPLVYSDQRLVDASGRVLRQTMWVGRSNNYTSMASLLVANTVTGASCLIRADVVQRALPFPDCPGIEFHDHWLALVALASGPIRYVDRPLYDYVQHPDAILGRVVGDEPSAGDARSHRHPRVTAARPARLPRPRLRGWRGAYFLGYLPGQMRAQTLLLRCDATLTAAHRRDLARYLRADASPAAFVWLWARPLRMLLGRTETRGGETELAVGIVWEWLVAIVARIPAWPGRWLPDTSFPDPLSFAQRRLGRWRRRI